MPILGGPPDGRPSPAADPVTPPAATPAGRCAVHPGRPAVDACLICERSRCALDAQAAPGGGCLGCQGRSHAGGPPDRRRPGSAAGRVAVTALALVPAALAGGWVSSQYVDAQVFSLVLPALTGCLCGWVTLRCARPMTRGPLGYAVRVLAVLAAVAGTVCSFRFVPGGQSALHPAGRVLPPYAAAAAAAWLWTRPPSRRRAQTGRGTRTT